MKKVFSCFAILVCFLVLGNIKNAYAAEIDKDDITNSTYVIGKCMFTRDVSDHYSGVLTTDVIMLAAKTIDSNNLEDMIIYYKNARGTWVNALTNQAVEMTENIVIEYKNNEVYVEKAELENVTLKNWEQAHPDTAYIPDLVNGVYSYDLGVISTIISGYEIYEKVGETYTKVGEGIPHSPETIAVSVAPGERKVFVARTYALKEDESKLYGDYSEELVIDHRTIVIPTLKNDTLEQWTQAYPDTVYVANLVNGKYMYDLGINNSAYVYHSGTITYATSISGAEVYEKVGDEYGEALACPVDGTCSVYVAPGEKKVYVARVYATKADGTKVYSNYSAEIVIDHRTIATPTLENETLRQWNLAYPDTPYIPNLVDGKYMYDLGINNSGYVNTHWNYASISGVEIYEKVGDEYGEAIPCPISGTTPVYVAPGESKVYVARVYVTKADETKVYSAYSNEIVINHNSIVVPTLTNDTLNQWETDFPDTPYIPNLANGKYMYDLGINTLSYVDTTYNRVSVSGYEVYEKNGDEYVSVGNGTIGGVVTVYVVPGERKVYVTRVYAIKADETKVYSGFSNEVVVDHSTIATPTLTNATLAEWQQVHPEDPYVPELVNGEYVYDMRINTLNYVDTTYNRVSVSGFEVYEKDGDEYTFVTSGTVAGVAPVSLEPGERKVYVAKVYALKEDNTKVYSAYSNEVVIDHSN